MAKTKKNNKGKKKYMHDTPEVNDVTRAALDIEDPDQINTQSEIDTDVEADVADDKAKKDQKKPDNKKSSDNEKPSNSKKTSDSGKKAEEHEDGQKNNKPAKEKWKFLSGIVSSSKKKTKSKVIKSKKKSKVVVFDAGAISFYLVALVAVLALTALAVNIMAPTTFDKVFYSTPTDRNGMVMQIGEYQVMTDEYTNIIMREKLNYGQTEADYWRKNPSDDKKLIQYVEEYLIMKYTHLEWAKDFGIVMNDDIKAKVDQETQEYIDENLEGDYETFLKMIDANYYTEDLYFRMAYQEELTRKFYEELRKTDIGKITEADYEAHGTAYNLMSAKHILIIIDENMSEAEIAEKEALAKDIKRRLDAGEDFDELMNTYSEDPGLEQYPDGYNFETGAFMQEFADACAELEVGEISDIVEVGYGYHIIMRIKTDYSIPVMREGNQEVSYEDEIISTRIADELVKKQEDIKIKYGRGYKYITVANVNYEFIYPQDGSDQEQLPADIDTENTDGEENSDSGDANGASGGED